MKFMTSSFEEKLWELRIANQLTNNKPTNIIETGNMEKKVQVRVNFWNVTIIRSKEEKVS